MRYFFDTSALVKVFHPEPGDEIVLRIYQEPGRRIHVAPLAVVELASALAIKVRTGAITDAEAEIFDDEATRSFSAGDVLVDRPRDRDYKVALHLMKRHGRTERLRALDALHLGAHGKLTTCARIELTTPKSGLATWQATESRASICVAGA